MLSSKSIPQNVLNMCSQVRELLMEEPCSSVIMAYGISAAGKTFTIEVGAGPDACTAHSSSHIYHDEAEAAVDDLTVMAHTRVQML